ncbi:MAG: CdaR family protein [Anaerolineales bacterium]|nr:CdaR family protein [Anaerolineales bacterium]
MLRWLWDNLSALLLALVLAFVVWLAAVNASDPVDVRAFPSSLPIDYVGVEDGLVVVGPAPVNARVTLRAPRSVWDLLTARDLHVEARMDGLAEGTHDISLVGLVGRQPARVTQIEPARLEITLEKSASQRLAIRTVAAGEPALGYRMDNPIAVPDTVDVTGPASLVDQAAEVLAQVDVTGRREDIDIDVKLTAVDASGRALVGLTLEPASARVVTTVHQRVGYRLVAVIPIIQGQVEPGYQVTSINVSPTLVTVFSPDPKAVEALPGFVETESINQTGARNDIEQTVGVQLPDGTFLAGSQAVIVQIQVAPIETTINVRRPVEVEHVPPGLFAQSSPATASVILKGPLPVLDRLLYEDVRVVLSVERLAAGTYQLAPRVIILPEGVILQTLLPETFEITLSRTPPPTSAAPAP